MCSQADEEVRAEAARGTDQARVRGEDRIAVAARLTEAALLPQALSTDEGTEPWR